jgi:pterin-4a-carbinolamine dehydratase
MNTQSKPAAPETIPERQPAAPEQLKAERVQLQIEAGGQRLKAERVQDRLTRMPGWRMTGRGRSLSRVREFPDAPTAAAYAGYLTQLAVQRGQPLSVELTEASVTVTVRGKAHRGLRAGLTEDDLEFARSLK